jgi:uncharacterized protein YdeI (YjbR/CyaY-like superfamily)
VDAYIAKSADFARPILRHLRVVVHDACPEVEETMKWSMPHFDYKGMLCAMASFQQHCTFGFWKGSLIVDRNGRSVAEAMGQFGRITAISDLPSKKILGGYVRAAAKLNDEGVKVVRSKPKPKKPVVVPADLQAALKRNRRAFGTFEDFSPSQKREYVEWITESKREETRERRLKQAVEWMSQGRARNWKYESC